MSRRRRQEEEHPNHERWLVSYADFITLLFAFFVVMYAISSVNEGKYRVLSNTLTGAFQEPLRSLDPIQVGELRRTSTIPEGDVPSQAPVETPTEVVESPRDIPAPPLPAPEPSHKVADPSAPLLAERQRLAQLSNTLETVLAPYVKDQSVTVTHHDTWVSVSMKSGLLFSSGEARLATVAMGMLRDITRVLAPLDNPVRVEGYTDNVPINTTAFPSNWELSAARAASVVHLFTRLGVAPERLAAVGYGEHRPIADNASEEGRRQNRRVTLIINRVAPDASSGEGPP